MRTCCLLALLVVYSCMCVCARVRARVCRAESVNLVKPSHFVQKGIVCGWPSFKVHCVCVCVCPCAYAGVPEDSTAANTLSYLLCQKPSQLRRGCDGDTPSPPSLGSDGEHAVNVVHWWEVLSAVQGLTQETQQHIFTLFGAEVSVHMLPLMVSVLLVAVCILVEREWFCLSSSCRG